MFKTIFSSETTKANVVLAVAGAVVAVMKAFDTYKDYKSDQEKKEITQ